MFDIIKQLRERFKRTPKEDTNIDIIDIPEGAVICSVCGGYPAGKRIRGRRDVSLCKPCKKVYHRELKVARHGI